MKTKKSCPSVTKYSQFKRKKELDRSYFFSRGRGGGGAAQQKSKLAMKADSDFVAINIGILNEDKHGNLKSKEDVECQ